MMANVAIYPTYALNIVVVNEYFYQTRFGIGFNYCLALATHLTGFGLAGICKRILIKPASFIWPQTLVTSTLLNTLHAEEDLMGSPGGGITRYRWFLYVTIGAFAWQWMPGKRGIRVTSSQMYRPLDRVPFHRFVRILLGVFDSTKYACSFHRWFNHNTHPLTENKVVNQLFGTMTGLGMSAISFDWNQISSIGSPLMVPWWAEIHIFIGFALFWWIVLPIMYYNNVRFSFSLYLPYPNSRF